MNQRKLTKRSEKGQGLVEYALLAVLIVIPLIGVLTLFGPEIKVIVNDLTYSVSGGYTVQNGVLVRGPTRTANPSFSSGTYFPTYTSVAAATLIPTYTSAPTITLTQAATTTLTATSAQTATLTQTATTTLTTTSTPTNTLTPTATPIGTWTTCANENGFCSFSGTAQVQYGANGVWVTQTHTNGVSCTNAVFGDPIPGVVKTCQYYQVALATPTSTSSPTATSAPQWIDCATQNGYCSFTGTYAVRFGRNSTWVTQIHTDGVACTTAIFGNPTWGTKKCQIYR